MFSVFLLPQLLIMCSITIRARVLFLCNALSTVIYMLHNAAHVLMYVIFIVKHNAFVIMVLHVTLFQHLSSIEYYFATSYAKVFSTVRHTVRYIFRLMFISFIAFIVLVHENILMYSGFNARISWTEHCAI